jgi:hypothetical protein
MNILHVPCLATNCQLLFFNLIQNVSDDFYRKSHSTEKSQEILRILYLCLGLTSGSEVIIFCQTNGPITKISENEGIF